MMSLRDCFTRAAHSVERFIDRQELKQLEANKAMARAGYIAIPGRTVLFTRITPEIAKNLMAANDRRIDHLRKKHGWTAKP